MKPTTLNLDLMIHETENIANDISTIISQSRHIAYTAVDVVLLKRNWLIGKRIAEEELKGGQKENYGLEIISKLSVELTKRFGKGFSRSNLYSFFKFYILYKNIFQTLSGQTLLTWSHYSLLIKINDQKARDWYEKEARECSWSVRTLQRNINTQYYYRLLASQVKEPVIEEMEEKIKEERLNKLEHIKNPVIFEFLGLSETESFKETDLEKAIISNIQKTLMELGKGYSLVARQYHIHTEAKDYYVDLVFYNFKIKCFVLVDLKTNKIEHEDVGQMDMYVRMFDELIKDESDNPTLGIILCSETDEDIARYSILKGSEHLFATKYKLYLPSEEELRAEIEHQKTLFYLSHNKKS